VTKRCAAQAEEIFRSEGGLPGDLDLVVLGPSCLCRCLQELSDGFSRSLDKDYED